MPGIGPGARNEFVTRGDVRPTVWTADPSKPPANQRLSASRPVTVSLRELTRSESVDARRAVAQCQRCPIECLEKLATDGDGVVRALTASNPRTPTRCLALLAQDKHIDVRKLLARNPAAPADTLRRLAGDTAEQVRRYVVDNPNTPQPALAVLAQDKSPYIRREIAERTTSSEVLATLADDEDENVRDCVARNVRTPTETLIRMAAGPPGPIAEAARRNLKARPL